MSNPQPTPDVPILVGAAQWSERLGEDAYEGLSPVDLAARAAGLAIDDTGAATGVRALLDVVACTRQFDESFPGMPAPLGRSDNFPRSVAGRLGLDPERVIYEVSGGQSPQHLVTELCGDLAAGRATVALIAGSEAISTVLDLARRPDGEKPDLTEQVEGQDGDRGAGLEGLTSRYQAGHGLIDAPTQYASSRTPAARGSGSRGPLTPRRWVRSSRPSPRSPPPTRTQRCARRARPRRSSPSPRPTG